VLFIAASACTGSSTTGTAGTGTGTGTTGTGTTGGTGRVAGSPTQGATPIPAGDVALKMPADMYLHTGAPTEWWWHIGTLRAGTRTFGFEINTASFTKDGSGVPDLRLDDGTSRRSHPRHARARVAE
jgi:hypothetical protein